MAYNPYIKPSVQNIMAQRLRGGPTASLLTDPSTGNRLTNQEAQARGPIRVGPTAALGPGTRGYRGSGVVGSAAGALGSPGTPTSQRGRFEKMGVDAASMPTWQAARANGSGMFGGGLQDLYNSMSETRTLPANAQSGPTVGGSIPVANSVVAPPTASPTIGADAVKKPLNPVPPVTGSPVGVQSVLTPTATGQPLGFNSSQTLNPLQSAMGVPGAASLQSFLQQIKKFKS